MCPFILRMIVVGVLVFGALWTNTRAEDWPQFGRDGTRNAVSPEKNAPTDWEVGEFDQAESPQRVKRSQRNIKWSARLGSNTFGDPVVSNGLVWVGTNNYYGRERRPDASVLACFRERDGELLYRYVSPRYPYKDHYRYDYPTSSMACSPFIDGDRLWFVTNRAEVVCLDIGPLRRGDGEPRTLWTVDMIGKFGVTPATPIMGIVKLCSIAGHKEFLYVITGHGRDSHAKDDAKPDAPSLLCLRKQTGELVWEDHSPGANILMGQWSSPTIIELHGKAQCVAAQGDGWVRSFDALTGKPVWQFDMNRKESVYFAGGRATRRSVLASPVFFDHRIYIATGQHPEWGPSKARLVCLDPTKSGDISSELAVDSAGKVLPHRRTQAVDAQLGEKAILNSNSGLVWEFTHEGNPKAFESSIHDLSNNVVIHNGLLFAADMDGLLHCFDAKTGQRHWCFDLLANCFGSPLIVDDKLYVLDADGEVAIFGLSADPNVAMRNRNGAFEPLRVVSVNSDFGLVQCSPIFANGVMYLASASELFAISANEPSQELDFNAGFWPQWRGPNRDNISLEKGLLKEWPEGGPPLMWRVEGLGAGIASPTMADGRVFTLGYFDDGEFLTALEQRTGQRLWATRIGPKVNENPLMRWLSQRSPTVDGQFVYAITTGGRLVCCDVRSGRELWSKNYTDDYGARRPGWGFCDYPLVDGDRLICTPGGNKASLVALEKSSGQEQWRSVVPGDRGPGFAALRIAKVGDVKQYVAFLGGALVAVHADNGQPLWSHTKVSISTANTHTPAVFGDHILASNGYGSGIALLKLVAKDRQVEAQEQYFEKISLDPFQDSSLLIGERFIDCIQTGIPVCIDAKTGQKAWPPTRVLKSPGRAALTFADERLYVRQNEGRLTLLEIAPTAFVERGTFEIPDAVKAAGSTFPIVAGGQLYIRDETKLLCYDIRSDALTRPKPDPRVVTLAAPKADAPATEPRERTLRSVFVPTPQDVVEKMLELADVKKSDVVFDLGSGDGRIVITAAKKFGCKAVGYELDKELVELSRGKAEAAGVKSLVTIEAKDLFTADLRDADVIAVYLLPTQLEKLMPQLEKLKPGVRIVSHYFSLPDTKPDRTLTVKSPDDNNEHTIYLWKTPVRRTSLQND